MLSYTSAPFCKAVIVNYLTDLKTQLVSLSSDETLGQPERIKELIRFTNKDQQDLSDLASLILKSVKDNAYCKGEPQHPWSHLKAP